MLSEALRVLQFRDICLANNGNVSDAVFIMAWELGKLMNEPRQAVALTMGTQLDECWTN